LGAQAGDGPVVGQLAGNEEWATGLGEDEGAVERDRTAGTATAETGACTVGMADRPAVTYVASK
jgi:hypothetical protein